MGKPGEHAEQPGGTDPEHALIPIRVLSDKFEWQVTHEHAAKCYQLERILVLERNKQIQGKARKITPSPDMPLNVIIIDELAYLSAMVPDKKLRDRGQAAIGTILVL